MTPSNSQIRVQDIDHCGIVAGIIDQMCLVEQINQILRNHHQEIVTPGEVVKAMIINGLSLVSAPLYLFEKFFVGKVTEHLLGEGISAEHLKFDRLGRVLDKRYGAGLTQVFVTLALAAASKFGVKKDSFHLDSSSFHVHGEYPVTGSDASGKATAIKITYGYSRDHRPDLKQFIVYLMCSRDGDIPLYLRVTDAALYSQENIKLMFSLHWVSGVPATLVTAKFLLDNMRSESFITIRVEGYEIAQCCSYCG
ncbi:hypothetical protein RintRC_4785 [Richelia intracellularis]|nr:hypothetical protein RintRC_4785 [Richelia intracellularis]